MEIKGKFNGAVVYTDLIEPSAVSQIRALCDQEWTAGSSIRIMPDVHAGAGCTIGTTMTLDGKVCPNLVGVDIGCGMFVARFGADSRFSRRFNAEKFDCAVKSSVPAGKRVHGEPTDAGYGYKGELLRLVAKTNVDYAMASIGTLGGGNHFIEVDRDDQGDLYVVIHSGSRHLGVEVCNHHQSAAIKDMETRGVGNRIRETIDSLKAEGRFGDIEGAIAALKSEHAQNCCPRELAFLDGAGFDAYINDMGIAQRFAELNRRAMFEEICRGYGIKDDPDEMFETVHNYIDLDSMVLRKGAVSAKEGETLIIPMNMRDGSLICVGKGNPEWNCSAPHGAGRLMSRGEARAKIDLDKFRRSMKGIYTTTVCKETIDEAPFAYKPVKSITDNIGGTVDIVRTVKPIYNFKASE